MKLNVFFELRFFVYIKPLSLEGQLLAEHRYFKYVYESESTRNVLFLKQHNNESGQ